MPVVELPTLFEFLFSSVMIRQATDGASRVQFFEGQRTVESFRIACKLVGFHFLVGLNVNPGALQQPVLPRRWQPTEKAMQFQLSRGVELTNRGKKKRSVCREVWQIESSRPHLAGPWRVRYQT